MSVTSANRLELLQIADAVAREKLIEPGLVIEAMEESLAKAARAAFERQTVSVFTYRFTCCQSTSSDNS